MYEYTPSVWNPRGEVFHEVVEHEDGSVTVQRFGHKRIEDDPEYEPLAEVDDTTLPPPTWDDEGYDFNDDIDWKRGNW